MKHPAALGFSLSLNSILQGDLNKSLQPWFSPSQQLFFWISVSAVKKIQIRSAPPCTARLTCAPYSYEIKCHASSMELISLSPSKDNMFWKCDSIVLAEMMPSCFILYLLVFPPKRSSATRVRTASYFLGASSEQTRETHGRNKRSKKQPCSNLNYHRILCSKPSNPEARE